ncbi:uncharacterized protein LOC108203539 [Daucus carota subsp. sativus]|uniref:uncharacterized protein LOC108203539 n=1 Tax=Daucus carota subsp. sativus TaxID=79200 RepID=UPI0007EF76E9|nr:PREDICTED: uncharacterized protein LOC108203539 [Daucus carota subsp. sativus]
MSEDILYQRRQICKKDNLVLSEMEIESYALAAIDKLLQSVGKSLKHFTQLPQPDESFMNCGEDNLIIEETSYNTVHEYLKHEDMISRLNEDQMSVYQNIMHSVDNKEGGLFFVYGSGGCDEDSSCNISHNSDIAQLLKKMDLIIWDEAPMQHRYAFEALDRTLRDIMKSVAPDRYHKVFGGITVLLGGDFRQILPVINFATRSEIVSASITRSRLWDECRIYLLSINMRVKKDSLIIEDNLIEKFNKWVLDVGDGKIPDCNGEEDGFDGVNIRIPEEFCILKDNFNVEDIIDSTYPDFLLNYQDESYISQCAILSPTNEIVQQVNSVMLQKIPGKCHSYLSIDSAEECGDTDEEFNASYPEEYLHALNEPGLPPHNVMLKKNVVVMLMRYLNQILGLCNGTRMIVRKCLKHCVMCEVISGSHKGSIHFIPRIQMSPSDSRLPFKLNRLQIPLQICYAMTINKSQGQSLDRVGLYLPSCVFSHG